MKVLITGGAGFIGSAVANHLHHLGHEVKILDCLTYAADMGRLNWDAPLHKLDITEPIKIDEEYDYILHLAAETHVDNSITDPLRFVKTNVLGTANMLEFARSQKNLKMFLYFSTDEVFGPAPAGTDYKEWDRYNSGNPYSAAKAGGEELVLAYGNTYKLPVTITHTMNAYGPSQHIEKFIPGTIDKVKKGEEVIIHSDPTKTISGSRYYIHTQDIAEAVGFVMEHGQAQEKYNIVGEREVSNLQVAQTVAELLGKELNYKMVDFHSSRPGHDLRYALDGNKLKAMGWTPKITFIEGIRSLL
jgi:dTDP-glucose 4,6-dehydratase